MRRNKVVNEGQTAVLECMAEGRPKPLLTWKKDNQSLELTKRHFHAANNQLLIIVKTTLSDSGKYTCEMRNTLGSRSDDTQLYVQSVDHHIPTRQQSPSSEESHMDESTTTGIIIIAVVCCVVGTSLVWVIIIYHTRKRQDLYTPASTEDTPIPAEYMGQPPYDDDYPQQVIMYSSQPGSYQQYQEYQSKESGYESSSGRSRAAKLPAIFPSDVEEGNHQLGPRVPADHSPGKTTCTTPPITSYQISFIDNITSSIIFFMEFLCFHTPYN